VYAKKLDNCPTVGAKAFTASDGDKLAGAYGTSGVVCRSKTIESYAEAIGSAFKRKRPRKSQIVGLKSPDQ
jgi:hypothetical protein